MQHKWSTCTRQVTEEVLVRETVGPMLAVRLGRSIHLEDYMNSFYPSSVIQLNCKVILSPASLLETVGWSVLVLKGAI